MTRHCRRPLAVIAAAVFFAMWFAAAAQAQTQTCGNRDAIIQTFVEPLGETQRARGLNQDIVMELWANEETGTWKLILVEPSGRACIMADGTAIQTFTTAIGTGA